MDFIKQTLRNFLNLYWIRPETALWRTLDVIQLRNIKFDKPIIDLGCGDGNFSFTHHGGAFDYSFDVYKTMKTTKGFFEGKDIHNQAYEGKPAITRKARMTVDVGLDWKENLLNKAENLFLYEKLIKHNLDKKIPFEDGKFETVFSNVFYWIKNIKQLINESKRILSDSGKIVIFVPDKNLKKKLIFNEYLQHGYEWAKILDRGIYQNITNHCYSYSEWQKIFSDSGLKIKEHQSYVSNKLVKFWSVGLRPYSPYIIEMANKLDELDKVKIKKRLIKDLMPLFSSFIEYELENRGPKSFHLFVLEKK